MRVERFYRGVIEALERARGVRDAESPKIIGTREQTAAAEVPAFCPLARSSNGIGFSKKKNKRERANLLYVRKPQRQNALPNVRIELTTLGYLKTLRDSSHIQ